MRNKFHRMTPGLASTLAVAGVFLLGATGAQAEPGLVMPTVADPA